MLRNQPALAKSCGTMRARHLQGRHPNRLSLQWLSLCDHSMQWLSSRHHHLHGRRHPHRALSIQGSAHPSGPSCGTWMLLHLLVALWRDVAAALSIQGRA